MARKSNKKNKTQVADGMEVDEEQLTKVDGDAEMEEQAEQSSAEEEVEEEEEEDDDDDEDDSDNDVLMADDTENMEKVNFDFEAFPLSPGDSDGLTNLLTQIFLRADVNCEAMAKALVKMTPLGCVYKPAEECEDEDGDSILYGVLSMLELGGTDEYEKDLANLILTRAKKHAVSGTLKAFENFFTKKSEKKKNYMLVNERMLHFPDQIAAPAFSSLKGDLTDMKMLDKVNKVVIISKVRIADAPSGDVAALPNVPGGKKKKKLGKAEKKRRAAEALNSADALFDNAEEQLLYMNGGAVSPTYFQYPVEADVERDSKFSRSVKDGVSYRPYRRVALLSEAEFLKFIDLVSSVSL